MGIREYGPRIRHINSAVAAIEVDVVAATRLPGLAGQCVPYQRRAMQRSIFKIPILAADCRPRGGAF